MSWTYTIDTERKVLLGTAAGILEAEELQTGVATATRDPRFHPDMRIFLDYRAVTELRFSIDTMEMMARNRVYSAKSRRAFLVPTAIDAGFFQYYRAIVETGRVEVFTDRAQALAWLNQGVRPEMVLT